MQEKLKLNFNQILLRIHIGRTEKRFCQICVCECAFFEKFLVYMNLFYFQTTTNAYLKKILSNIKTILKNFKTNYYSASNLELKSVKMSVEFKITSK